MPSRPDDPVFLRSRREAFTALALWAACGVYTLSYCYFGGYDRDPATVETWLGIPDWVFWGVFCPWLVTNALAAWFAFGVMEDDDLGEEIDWSPAQDDPAAQAPADRGPGETPQEGSRG